MTRSPAKEEGGIEGRWSRAEEEEAEQAEAEQAGAEQAEGEQAEAEQVEDRSRSRSSPPATRNTRCDGARCGESIAGEI